MTVQALLGSAPTAAAELKRLTAQPEFSQVSPDRASLLAFRNGFLELFKEGQRDWLLQAQQQLKPCGWNAIFGFRGKCDVLSDRFLDDAMTYAGNLIKIKWWSFFVAGPSEFGGSEGESLIVDILVWIKLINLYAANESFPCDYKCVTDTCGPVFWQVYAGYWFAVMCQELIDTAIANGWVS